MEALEEEEVSKRERTSVFWASRNTLRACVTDRWSSRTSAHSEPA